MARITAAIFAFCLMFVSLASSQTATPAPSASATKVDPAFEADIRRLMADSGMDDMLKLQIEQMLGPMSQMLKANPNVTPEFVDEFVRRIKTKFLDGRVQDAFVEEYAQFFTRDDVQKMIAYQESPIGRKAKQVMPQMMSDFGSKMRGVGEHLGQQIGEEVAKEHPEWMKSGNGQASKPPTNNQ